MTKKSTITNLLVVPLIASAIFLASPAFASNTTNMMNGQVRHKTNIPNIKKGVVGTVISTNGTIVIVKAKDNVEYTVDTTSATIMKASTESNTNPTIVTISDIKVGDVLMVRGKITDTEITAEKIFDGKMPMKHLKHNKHLRKKF